MSDASGADSNSRRTRLEYFSAYKTVAKRSGFEAICGRSFGGQGQVPDDYPHTCKLHIGDFYLESFEVNPLGISEYTRFGGTDATSARAAAAGRQNQFVPQAPRAYSQAAVGRDGVGAAPAAPASTQ